MDYPLVIQEPTTCKNIIVRGYGFLLIESNETWVANNQINPAQVPSTTNNPIDKNWLQNWNKLIKFNDFDIVEKRRSRSFQRLLTCWIWFNWWRISDNSKGCVHQRVCKSMSHTNDSDEIAYHARTMQETRNQKILCARIDQVLGIWVFVDSSLSSWWRYGSYESTIHVYTCLTRISLHFCLKMLQCWCLTCSFGERFN